LRTARFHSAHDISRRIAKQQTQNGSDHGYPDRINKSIHGLGLHPEFTKIHERQLTFVVGESVIKDKAQRHYHKTKKIENIGNRPTSPFSKK
jgi:hypothetical protein